MPLTQQQRAIIDGLEQEEQAEAALDAFISEGGDEIAPYLDGATAFANAQKMVAWALSNLGRDALLSPSGFEISFNNCRASLAPDPSWKTQAQVFRDFEANITSPQWKQLYAGEVPNLRADQRAALERIGGPEGFKQLIDGGKQ